MSTLATDEYVALVREMRGFSDAIIAQLSPGTELERMGLVTHVLRTLVEFVGLPGDIPATRFDEAQRLLFALADTFADALEYR